MKFRRLESCCIRGSLQLGTILTGALGIILSIITIIFVLVVNTTSGIKLHTIDFIEMPPIAVKIVIVINLLMTIFISSLLIAGAIKRNRWLMLPWICLGFVLAIGLLVSILYTTIVYFIAKKNLVASLILVFGLIVLAVYIYLWLVVFSFYRFVQETKSRPYTYNQISLPNPK